MAAKTTNTALKHEWQGTLCHKGKFISRILYRGTFAFTQNVLPQIEVHQKVSFDEFSNKILGSGLKALQLNKCDFHEDHFLFLGVVNPLNPGANWLSFQKFLTGTSSIGVSATDSKSTTLFLIPPQILKAGQKFPEVSKDIQEVLHSTWMFGVLKIHQQFSKELVLTSLPPLFPSTQSWPMAAVKTEIDDEAYKKYINTPEIKTEPLTEQTATDTGAVKNIAEVSADTAAATDVGKEIAEVSAGAVTDTELVKSITIAQIPTDTEVVINANLTREDEGTKQTDIDNFGSEVGGIKTTQENNGGGAVTDTELVKSITIAQIPTDTEVVINANLTREDDGTKQTNIDNFGSEVGGIKTTQENNGGPAMCGDTIQEMDTSENDRISVKQSETGGKNELTLIGVIHWCIDEQVKNMAKEQVTQSPCSDISVQSACPESLIESTSPNTSLFSRPEESQTSSDLSYAVSNVVDCHRNMTPKDSSLGFEISTVKSGLHAQDSHKDESKIQSTNAADDPKIIAPNGNWEDASVGSAEELVVDKNAAAANIEQTQMVGGQIKRNMSQRKVKNSPDKNTNALTADVVGNIQNNVTVEKLDLVPKVIIIDLKHDAVPHKSVAAIHSVPLKSIDTATVSDLQKTDQATENCGDQALNMVSTNTKENESSTLKSKLVEQVEVENTVPNNTTTDNVSLHIPKATDSNDKTVLAPFVIPKLTDKEKQKQAQTYVPKGINYDEPYLDKTQGHIDTETASKDKKKLSYSEYKKRLSSSDPKVPTTDSKPVVSSTYIITVSESNTAVLSATSKIAYKRNPMDTFATVTTGKSIPTVQRSAVKTDPRKNRAEASYMDPSHTWNHEAPDPLYNQSSPLTSHGLTNSHPEINVSSTSFWPVNNVISQNHISPMWAGLQTNNVMQEQMSAIAANVQYYDMPPLPTHSFYPPEPNYPYPYDEPAQVTSSQNEMFVNDERTVPHKQYVGHQNTETVPTVQNTSFMADAKQLPAANVATFRASSDDNVFVNRVGDLSAAYDTEIAVPSCVNLKASYDSQVLLSSVKNSDAMIGTQMSQSDNENCNTNCGLELKALNTEQTQLPKLSIQNNLQYNADADSSRSSVTNASHTHAKVNKQFVPRSFVHDKLREIKTYAEKCELGEEIIQKCDDLLNMLQVDAAIANTGGVNQECDKVIGAPKNLLKAFEQNWYKSTKVTLSGMTEIAAANASENFENLEREVEIELAINEDDFELDACNGDDALEVIKMNGKHSESMAKTENKENGQTSRRIVSKNETNFGKAIKVSPNISEVIRNMFEKKFADYVSQGRLSAIKSQTLVKAKQNDIVGEMDIRGASDKLKTFATNIARANTGLMHKTQEVVTEQGSQPRDAKKIMPAESSSVQLSIDHTLSLFKQLSQHPTSDTRIIVTSENNDKTTNYHELTSNATKHQTTNPDRHIETTNIHGTESVQITFEARPTVTEAATRYVEEEEFVPVRDDPESESVKNVDDSSCSRLGSHTRRNSRDGHKYVGRREPWRPIRKQRHFSPSSQKFVRKHSGEIWSPDTGRTYRDELRDYSGYSDESDSRHRSRDDYDPPNKRKKRRGSVSNRPEKPWQDNHNGKPYRKNKEQYRHRRPSPRNNRGRFTPERRKRSGSPSRNTWQSKRPRTGYNNNNEDLYNSNWEENYDENNGQNYEYRNDSNAFDTTPAAKRAMFLSWTDERYAKHLITVARKIAFVSMNMAEWRFKIPPCIYGIKERLESLEQGKSIVEKRLSDDKLSEAAKENKRKQLIEMQEDIQYFTALKPVFHYLKNKLSSTETLANNDRTPEVYRDLKFQLSHLNRTQKELEETLEMNIIQDLLEVVLKFKADCAVMIKDVKEALDLA